MILDSGATSQIITFKDQLFNICAHNSTIRTANGITHTVTGLGSASFECDLPNGDRSSIVFTDVLLVPNMGNLGLVSETILDENGFGTESGGGNKLVTKERKGTIWAKLDKVLCNLQVVSNTVSLTTYSE